MNPGETPVAVVSLNSEEGEDLLIGEKDGTLIMYKLTQSKSLIECNNVIEERWSGDISIVSTEDEYAHIVWTRRYMGPNSFLMQTLSYSTVDSSCMNSRPRPSPRNSLRWKVLGSRHGRQRFRDPCFRLPQGCIQRWDSRGRYRHLPPVRRVRSPPMTGL